MGKKLIFLLFTAGTIALSIWGPEILAEYKDRAILNQIHAEQGTLTEAGYRYTLSSNEKLFILSEALSSQKIADRQSGAMNQNQTADQEYQQINGSYALVVNHRQDRQADDKIIGSEDLYLTFERELEELIGLGILPESLISVNATTHDAVLYSAIDVLEPRNNVAVWKISLSNIQKNGNKQNRLIDAYIDADSGKIYEFYVRTEYRWEDIEPDEIIAAWRGYMELGTPFTYETPNPLLETTPYFKQYLFAGKGDGQTIVTIGFYEGINELFLRVSH